VTKKLCVLFLSGGCVLAAVREARAGGALGVETRQFQADLQRTDRGGAPGASYTAHHSVSSYTIGWSPKRNVGLTLGFGTVSGNLETIAPDGDVTSEGTDGGIHFSAGLSLEQEFLSGGSLVLDISHSVGRLEWEDAGATKEYNHDLTKVAIGYVFASRARARPYAGVSYSDYSSENTESGSGAATYKYDEPLSFVIGLRAPGPVVSGMLEGSVGGEFGLRVGLAFNF
jgi:hypothetical protein